MKAAFFRVIKAPAIGDDIRICYTDLARGGRGEAPYIVKRKDVWRPVGQDEDIAGRETWTEQIEPENPPTVYVKRSDEEMLQHIAEQLGEMIKRTWENEMFGCQVRPKGAEVVITYSHNQQFFPMHNGTERAGNEYLVIDQDHPRQPL